MAPAFPPFARPPGEAGISARPLRRPSPPVPAASGRQGATGTPLSGASCTREASSDGVGASGAPSPSPVVAGGPLEGMFEESEWGDEEEEKQPRGGEQRGPPGAKPSKTPRRTPPSDALRRRLLATLRRLQSAGQPRETPATPDGNSSEEAEGEPETGRPPRAKKKRRRTRGRRGEEGEEPPLQQPGVPSDPEKERPRNGEAAPQVGPTEGAPARPRKGSGKEDAAASEQPRLTRKQWRNRQKNKRRQKNRLRTPGEDSQLQFSAPGEDLQPPVAEEELPGGGEANPTEPRGDRAAALRLRMEERLEGARFRYLNQLLYSRPSGEAARLFEEDPEAFAVYHRGFARQMAQWPQKPVQHIVRYLRHRPASLVVADFGCGDCTLARSVRNKVHCFDVVALDPRVTICDMAKVPLEAESVDVAVFCLALMGTNVQEILGEASRVLRLRGTLLVAEVASRFPDTRAFVAALARLGFSLRSQDVSGSHFHTFEFAKTAPFPVRTKPLPGLELRPCLYKRR